MLDSEPEDDSLYYDWWLRWWFRHGEAEDDTTSNRSERIISLQIHLAEMIEKL